MKKYQTGGPTSLPKVKSKTVTKSSVGYYKTVEKHKFSPKGISDSSNTRRTIKGVVKGAPKPGTGAELIVTPKDNKAQGKLQISKKGGSVKNKK